jgi:hypothetical protein
VFTTFSTCSPFPPFSHTVAQTELPATETPTEVAVGAARVRQWFDFICGIPKGTSGEQDEPQESQADRLKLLEEQPFWKAVLDLNAVLALCIMCFLVGYFA